MGCGWGKNFRCSWGRVTEMLQAKTKPEQILEGLDAGIRLDAGGSGSLGAGVFGCWGELCGMTRIEMGSLWMGGW